MRVLKVPFLKEKIFVLELGNYRLQGAIPPEADGRATDYWQVEVEGEFLSLIIMAWVTGANTEQYFIKGLWLMQWNVEQFSYWMR